MPVSLCSLGAAFSLSVSRCVVPVARSPPQYYWMKPDCSRPQAREQCVGAHVVRLNPVTHQLGSPRSDGSDESDRFSLDSSSFWFTSDRFMANPGQFQSLHITPCFRCCCSGAVTGVTRISYISPCTSYSCNDGKWEKRSLVSLLSLHHLDGHTSRGSLSAREVSSRPNLRPIPRQRRTPPLILSALTPSSRWLRIFPKVILVTGFSFAFSAHTT